MVIDILLGIIVAAMLIIASLVAIATEYATPVITGGSAKPVTYIISARSQKYLTKEVIKKYIPSNWKRVFDINKPVGMIIGVAEGLEHRLRDTPARLKYRMDTAAITDKAALHQAATSYGIGKHFAETYEIKLPGETHRDPTYTPEEIFAHGPGPWIIRANFGWGGSANDVVTSVGEMEEVVAKYRVAFAESKHNLVSVVRIIASVYISNPMLIRGYKFHVRFDVMIASTTHKYAVLSTKTICLCSSAKPYHSEDYADRGMHDTHWKHAAFEGFLPDDAPNGQLLIDNTLAAFKDVFAALLPLVKTYPEAENSYDFLGVDVMFLPDATPVILEINALPGIYDFYAELYLSNVVGTAVADVFGMPRQQLANGIVICGKN